MEKNKLIKFSDFDNLDDIPDMIKTLLEKKLEEEQLKKKEYLEDHGFEW